MSRSGENYDEAIDCLRSRYNRPRLLHRAHVQMITEAPPLKDGSEKELRRLHDTVQQHLRALKVMEAEPNGAFITSIIELKLDVDTMFEWQRHSQDKTEEVPPYQDILEFLDLRAQASETSLPSVGKRLPKLDHKVPPTIPSFPANPKTVGRCVVCTTEKHPLYGCHRFKALPHDEKKAVVKKNHLCMNCLNDKHFARDCKSSYKCKTCQKSHTLLHLDTVTNHDPVPPVPQVPSNAAVKLKSSALLMTCKVLITSPDGLNVEARALLDNASSASFVSERLVQSLNLPRTRQKFHIFGIAGSSPRSPVQSTANIQVKSMRPKGKVIDNTAIIVPCDLPVSPIPYDPSWEHLSGIDLADPMFGVPGRIDLLLGVDVFVSVLLPNRRAGLPGTHVALETEFGWVLCGNSESSSHSPTKQVPRNVTSFCASLSSNDDMLRKHLLVVHSLR